MPNRVVVWFSCGAASAVAAKMAMEDDYLTSEVVIVYCDTMRTEHPDNKRFFDECWTWFDRAITVIRSDKFQTVDEVFMARHYMSGPRGAPCTVEMKKIPRFRFQQPDDINIFGFTAEEGKRISRFEANNPELLLKWNLRDAGLSKEDCLTKLRDAGIKPPVMYELGFKNNNCLGCVKATSAKYWAMTRQHFPEVFQRRVEQSRKLGVRLARYRGQRIFLDELPNEITRGRLENISCGPECGIP